MVNTVGDLVLWWLTQEDGEIVNNERKKRQSGSRGAGAHACVCLCAGVTSLFPPSELPRHLAWGGQGPAMNPS